MKPEAARMTGPRTGGFTLTEVLVALLILSIGAASILALFAAAAATHRRAVERTSAALLAERVLAEARGSYFVDRDPEEIVAEVKARLPGDPSGYDYDLSLWHPAGDGWTEDELVVRVAVKWSAGGGVREEVFRAVLLPRPRE
jgi:prepilin-type N-terminal cleavage/methylation domain-containing protein